MRKSIAVCNLLLIVSFLTVSSGCRTSGEVRLSSDFYQPSLSTQMKVYKGKKVFLDYFANHAENTSQWAWPSKSGDRWYVVNRASLESYFWYCFRPALESAGMQVFERNPGNVPRFTMTLNYMDDHRITVSTMLSNRGKRYNKQHTITWQPPQTKDKTALASSMYKLMDKTIATIFTDPGFIKVFFAVK